MGYSKRVRMSPVELVNRISEMVHLSKMEVKDVLYAQAYVVEEEIAAGKDIHLYGIGTITCVRLPATRARNPYTRELIEVPPRRVPKLRATKALKKAAKEFDKKRRPIDIREHFGIKKRKKEKPNGEVCS